MTRARAFHLFTFLVTAFALVLQLVLVIQGHKVLDESSRPDEATRVLRYCSYLTIWSNALVAWSTATLAFGVDRDSRVWRALRLDAVVICFGGGVVHFFLLRPLLDLDGADLLADKLLHTVVPLLAVIGWLAFGPRGRATRDDVLPFLVVPVAWLGYTLVRGAFVDWYPYPFVDVGEHGYGIVLLNVVGISAFLVALAFGAIAVDRALSSRTAEG
ncbi:F420-dependent oxidoreductase [Nocardioides humilatus]|uniref:F420-dependent oxidoreductase n=1 Tax=Nocardioides humilatus TaxID=2607660 RepID=A0A5B1LEC6_9ACTN|nr:Pr6Pr family membrane protein [Nocardioides humilatus]KAA1419081.1 F420-dependent oxidoreductase [Nocardioides humilatus]